MCDKHEIKGEVYELCDHCGNEFGVRWDVETDGHYIYCPYCGKLVMICNLCDHDNVNCSKCPYDEERPVDASLELIFKAIQNSSFDNIDRVYLEEGIFYKLNNLHHLCCLWVAHCLEHNLEPDTYKYDRDLLTVYSALNKEHPRIFPFTIYEEDSDWERKDSLYKQFDLFMGQYLV